MGSDNIIFKSERLSKDVRKYVLISKDTLFSTIDVFSIFVILFVFFQSYYRFHSVDFSAKTLPTWIWLVVFFLVCRVLWRLYSIKQESVYVIRDMGIQLNRRRFIGFQSCRFIEKSKISAVVINEGITCGDIIFYLAILIRGQNKMVLVFEVSVFMYCSCKIFRQKFADVTSCRDFFLD